MTRLVSCLYFMKVNTKSNAYNRGKKSKRHTNPYREGTKEWNEWRKGYVDAFGLDNPSDVQLVGIQGILSANETSPSVDAIEKAKS